MTGEIKSGFQFEIEEEALDDYELIEALVDVDGGKFGRIVDAAKMLLGEQQHAKLKEHIRGTGKRVSAKEMISAVTEIMESCKTGKN